MNRVIVSVGSNINVHENIDKARAAIEGMLEIVKVSAFRETQPIGEGLLPHNFLNGVFLIQTEWSQEKLKLWLKKLEHDLGRSDHRKATDPLPIDLDIVVWNGDIIDSDVYERDFLKAAVLEVVPELKINQ